jgi:hypothetical protein
MKTLITILLAMAGALAAVPVQAHKASDAYLLLQQGPEQLTLRVDVALRDLELALDLDTDGDERLTWGEVRTAWPAIESYIAARVRVPGCALRAADLALERRNDGAYAAVTLAGNCPPGQGEPVIRYTVLREVDPTHRGIARIAIGDAPPVLRVLDPGNDAAMATPPTADSRHTDTTAAAPPSSFFREGVHHIVTGYDHVLFLLCLLLPSVVRRRRDGWQPVQHLREAVLPVAVIVTAFTVAHSITLALAAAGRVALPPSFIEPAIAVTIVLAAIDNIRPIFGGRRRIVTFLFGLIHGFGFAGVLGELDLSAGAFAWALLQFNLGLEAGQLAIVLLVTTGLYLLRTSPGYPRWVIRGGSAVAIAVGVVWLIERTADVSLLPL